jgi:hypothetical protein
MRIVLVALIACLALAACATGERAAQLREGMSQAQVTDILGQPDRFERRGGRVAVAYVNRLISGWGHDRADYVMLFEDDRLASWGPLNVRHVAPPDMSGLMALGLMLQQQAQPVQPPRPVIQCNTTRGYGLYGGYNTTCY